MLSDFFKILNKDFVKTKMPLLYLLGWVKSYAIFVCDAYMTLYDAYMTLYDAYMTKAVPPGERYVLWLEV